MSRAAVAMGGETARRAAIAMLAMATAGLAMAGCRERAGKAGEPAAPVAWTVSCGPALQGLSRVPAEQRVAAVLAACPVCAAGPILRDRRGLQRTPTYLTDMAAAIQGCGGFCNQTGRHEFLRNLQHQADEGEASVRPWWQLAERCPVELGWRYESRNFIGATWFLLERIASAAGRELAVPLAAAASFPLPAVAEGGRGLELPPAPAPGGARVELALPGRLAVTVLAETILVGRLPWGELTAAGVKVDGDYPGEHVPEPDEKLAEGLTAALAAQQKLLVSVRGGPADDAPVTLIAPIGLPARRLAETLHKLERPARLAVLPASTLPEYEPPMALPVQLRRPDGTAASAKLTLGDEAALAAAAGLPADATIELVAGADTTVLQLAQALARLPAQASVQLSAAPPAPPAPPALAPPAPPSPTK